MSTINPTWRVNEQGMEKCCKATWTIEMYRRQDAGEPLLNLGDTLKCNTCNGQMICDLGTEDKLRWRWKGEEERNQRMSANDNDRPAEAPIGGDVGDGTVVLD